MSDESKQQIARQEVIAGRRLGKHNAASRSMQHRKVKEAPDSHEPQRLNGVPIVRTERAFVGGHGGELLKVVPGGYHIPVSQLLRAFAEIWFSKRFWSWRVIDTGWFQAYVTYRR